MAKSPKTLTAIVHVKFGYGETESKPVEEDDVEMIGRILEKASELDPQLRELLIKFADFLKAQLN